MAWTSPKLDWLTNPVNPTPTDLDRIEGNIDFLKTDIETKKGEIVDALNAVGITASLTDTYAELATKLKDGFPKFASGTVTSFSSTARITMEYANTTITSDKYFLRVTGMDFKPSFIYAYTTGLSTNFSSIYTEESDGYYTPTIKIFGWDGDDRASLTNFNFKGDVGVTINTTQFELPVGSSSTLFNWIAFE
jgi:hypothetical protein